jgi:hypothetical protein
MINLLKLSAVLLAFPLGAADLAESPFQREMMAVWKEIEPAVQKATAVMETGDMERGNRLMLELAEPKGSPMAAFLVGNILYRIDTNAAARLHRRAYEAYPEEPMAIMEWAMELHRQGDYKKAATLYETALKKLPSNQHWALLADCLVREGRWKEAVAAWEAADHGRNHTGIDFAIHEIYGRLLPSERRGELLAKARAGDQEALEEAVLFDTHFEVDWWNAPVNAAAAAADLQLAEKQWGKDASRYQALALYVRLKKIEDPRAREVRDDLTRAKLLIGPDATLPESPRMTHALFELAVVSRAAAAEDLLRQHEPALVQQTKATKPDKHALHALCYLCSKAGNGRVAEFARIGWEKLGDPVFAASVLSELAAQNKLKPDDKLLLAALAQAPENNLLNMLRLAAAKAAGLKPDKEMLVAAIKAEYRHLSAGSLMTDSYTLKGLFVSLADTLGLGEK